jgi:hypothetical protein
MEMILHGNSYTATEDHMGNVTIRRKSDGATCYLQGDDATEFVDNHRILDAIEYPSGLFKTSAEHIDACLDSYDEVLEVRHV